METVPQLLVSSNRLAKRGIEPETLGLQAKWFIYNIVAAPFKLGKFFISEELVCPDLLNKQNLSKGPLFVNHKLLFHKFLQHMEAPHSSVAC